MPINKVLQKFSETLNAESETNNPMRLKGSISNKTFVMSVLSVDVEDPNFSAALRGTILETNLKLTHIEIFILRDASSYLFFFFCVLGAIFYFVMYYNNPDNHKTLYYGLATLILGTILSIWFSNSSIKTLQKKFEIFLKDSELVY